MKTRFLHTRLKMALLLHSGESGFAIVIAVSLGLIMILVGLSMTIRSQGDQVLSSTQKATDQALAAAEKGVAFYQQLINTNRMLAVYNDCTVDRTTAAAGTTCSNTTAVSWSNAATVPIPGSNSACNPGTADSTTIAGAASTSWQAVDSTDVTKGQFRLVRYSYNPQTNPPNQPSYPGNGTLIVEGRMANSTSNNAQTNAITQLKVVIPVKEPERLEFPIPGVWVGASATEDPSATGGNKIKGDVLVNNCTISFSEIEVTTGYTVRRTAAEIPNVPGRPSALMPSGTVIPLGMISSSTTGATQSGGQTRLTLPRTGDGTTTFNGQATYVYEVSTIAQNTDLTITAGQRVVIFLTGSINANNVTISHSCTGVSGCKPTNFQIYGEATSGNPQICLNGGNYMDAFILAPQYMVGVSGAGGDGGVRGAVWTKRWGNDGNDGGNTCGSNTNNIVVVQTASWDDVGNVSPKYQPPRLAPISQWQRQSVNN